MKKFIIINDKDNVMVALEDFKKGDIVNNIEIKEDIAKGHKVTIKDINENEEIIKYGYPIGTATKNILKGSHVHIHNIKTTLSKKHDFTYQFTNNSKLKQQNRKVNAYLRKNNKVGIRNEIWIIPTVGCVNGQAQILKQQFLKKHKITNNYDGVYAFTHPYGCSQMGEDHENTKKALQNIVKHPNAGGVLVIGLGCENNQIKAFKETIGEIDSSRIKFMICQEEKDEITKGLELLEEIYQEVITDQRTLCDLSKINLGLKCGGSDGLSGLTANPLIGMASDYIIANGGTAVLTEIPEMFGAEQVLLNRCENEEIYQKLLNIIDDFKDYYKKNNQVIYENPSPGNKAGGISTLEDKSLGCVQKSGTSLVKDVLKYAEPITKQGLNVLSGPGNDLIATTALGISGCQLVLFSTGRGTPFGSFIPTMKISTNSELASNKTNWIDFNAGELNDTTKEQIKNDFIEEIIKIIEGKYTKNEINDFHEIAIFKSGVTL